MSRQRTFFNGDKVRIIGDEELFGTVLDYFYYEDDDGEDEESGCQIIRRIFYYKVETEDGRILMVRDYNCAAI